MQGGTRRPVGLLEDRSATHQQPSRQNGRKCQKAETGERRDQRGRHHVGRVEIDPAIERIARTSSSFTFLDRCGERCRVIVGDARLSLARMPERAYDLLIRRHLPE